ncbi:hypothetical protein [Paenibacillus sp. FSL M7-0420]|uniref:hypothetical protein n=1 Tax=Paenibacillus sp. FSL M7-0420 TaxID=2921609 RepID=UPI0030F7647B
MTIFWINNRNDFADLTEQPDMVKKPATFDAAEASGPDMVEKPTTFGAAEACGPDMFEKPTTIGAAEACGPDMFEKPTTFGEAEACGPDMVEKPITFGMPQAFCSFYCTETIITDLALLSGSIFINDNFRNKKNFVNSETFAVNSTVNNSACIPWGSSRCTWRRHG